MFAAAVLIGAGALGMATASAVPQGAGPGAQPYIVGGEQAQVTDHPYVVYLADRRERQYCGGALIAPDRVVTAAHCVARTSRSSLRVVSGRQNVESDEGTVSEVVDVWVPENYRRVTDGNDIAVLTLAESVPYRAIKPAGERDAKLYQPGRKATVFGWGRTDERGTASEDLRSATVPVQPDQTCADVYEGYLPEQMVCAGYPEGGIDACQGDSGGPLVAGGKLIGVVSYGEGCARPNRPGVYTEVAAYAEEIAAAGSAGEPRRDPGVPGLLGG